MESIMGGFRNTSRDLRQEEREQMIRDENRRKALERNPLEGNDVALYVNGARVSVLEAQCEGVDGGRQVVVTFRTTVEAALTPDSNASVTLAWNGLKPNDFVHIKVDGKPMGGVAQLQTVIVPQNEGEIAKYVVKALTDLHDWTNGGRLIGKAGDICEVPAGLVRKADNPTR